MDDKAFMREAIKQAKKADYPYGAVLTLKGKIIAKAGTASKTSFDPTAHAEMTVIRNATKKLKNKKLTGTVLYTTCEPCPMCFTACWWAGVSTIVYGMTLKDSSKLIGKELEISSSTLNKKGGNKIVLVPKFRKEVLKIVK